MPSPGDSNWLEIAVSTNGANNFTTLAPRQQLTPAPYAITAENLSGVVGNNVPPTGAFGTISGGQDNLNNADYATISGGQTNTIQSNATGSFIGGGDLNNIGAGGHSWHHRRRPGKRHPSRCFRWLHWRRRAKHPSDQRRICDHRRWV